MHYLRKLCGFVFNCEHLVSVNKIFCDVVMLSYFKIQYKIPVIFILNGYFLFKIITSIPVKV